MSVTKEKAIAEIKRQLGLKCELSTVGPPDVVLNGYGLLELLEDKPDDSIGGCVCGAKFYLSDKAHDHDCPNEKPKAPIWQFSIAPMNTPA